MQLAETHIALLQENPIRLQEYAVGIFNSVSTKSGIKKAIKKGLILVDNQPASTALLITGGEKIELFYDENNQQFKKLEFPLEVLFEDNHLAVVYKPAGVLVSGNKFVTIANALPQNLKKSNQTDAVRPQPVHRLDYPTSGLLLIGKTNRAITLLSRLFENREIQKTYHAICVGEMKQKGTINFIIQNKESLTTYHVLDSVKSERFDFLNLAELFPKTGRKHQLRIHMASIGNQILGDKDYGNEDIQLKGKGLYLHASTLTFHHPFTKELISISKELPKKFKKIFP